MGNELSITGELWEICLARAKERLGESVLHSKPCKYAEKNKNKIHVNTRKIGKNSEIDGFFPSLFDCDSCCEVSSASPEPPPSPVDRESTVELIHLDVARTFPSLGIFQRVRCFFLNFRYF